MADVVKAGSCTSERAAIPQEARPANVQPSAVQNFERHPRLAKWVERLANAKIEGLSLSEWNDFLSALNAALSTSESIVALARELVSPAGMVNRGVDRGLVVIEKADKSDPHYRLCTALERHARAEGRPNG